MEQKLELFLLGRGSGFVCLQDYTKVTRLVFVRFRGVVVWAKIKLKRGTHAN